MPDESRRTEAFVRDASLLFASAADARSLAEEFAHLTVTCGIAEGARIETPGRTYFAGSIEGRESFAFGFDTGRIEMFGAFDEIVRLALFGFAVQLGARIDASAARPRQPAHADLALTDALTGLANRRAFDESLNREWRRCARSSAPLSLLVIDVDYFKVYNDTYGHVAGDECLRQVAAAIAACAGRSTDVAARYGGEEFAVLLPETALENAAHVADSINRRIWSCAIAHDGSSLGRVTVSIGCASIVPASGEAPQTLVETADRHLYAAKERGRNRFASEQGVSDGARVFRRVAATGNIAPARTPFVGRGSAIGELQNLLAAHRLVTIHGFGGSGKTRLALETARSAKHFADGAWFVDLTAQTDVTAAIAAALLPDAPSNVSLNRILQFVRNKELLIVLDNCEHLIEESARVADALIAAPNVRVLATSREPLAIEGEYVYRLEPLGDGEAQELFMLRAAAAGAPAPVLSEAGVEIAEIARWTEGIPLALELAAAHAGSMRLSEILSELTIRLTATSRSVSERHKTLFATLDWSYKLLPQREQHIFRSLCIFEGGWYADAAQAFFGAQYSAQDVTAALDALAQKSLIVTDGTRMRLLEPMREYAMTLTPQTVLETLRDRHARTYLELVSQRHREDVQNYVPAIARAIDLDEDVDRIGKAVWETREILSRRVRESLPFLDALCELAARQNTGARTRARILTSVASFLNEADPSRSDKLLEEACALLEREGRDIEWAEAVNERLSTALWTGKMHAVSLADIDAVCVLLDSGAGVRDPAHGFMLAGCFAADNGDVDLAMQRFRHALEIVRESNPILRDSIRGNIAMALMRSGEYEKATAEFADILRQAEKRGPWNIPLFAINLALAQIGGGAERDAVESVLTALRALETYPSDFVFAAAFDACVLTATALGFSEEAAEFAGFAQARFSAGVGRQPEDQRLFDEAVAVLRDRLGSGFEAIFAQGAALEPAQAVRLAVDTLAAVSTAEARAL
ncbi:MAG TPA: diguanylate cyclase [Candidatus Baltobacteraceae bacterium]|nr:diguanylate cyclase [Candidatus Baltobacteraceae bacterium]